MRPTLSTQEAKALYDRFGSKQDTQAFYEDAATEDLIAHAGFGAARAVFEFGCGTGRFAQRLLRSHLPADAVYAGVDVSTTMVDLARRRVSAWAARAQIALTDGSTTLDAPDDSIDRFVSNYVLDLLSAEDTRRLLCEAHRVLMPDGLLCLTGLTPGTSILSQVVTPLWRTVFSINPKLTGGCRPIEIRDHLPARDWDIRHHGVVTRFGIGSQVVIASPRKAASA